MPAPSPAAALKPKRRFAAHHAARPETVRGLAADHPAVVEGRTLFPSRVFSALDVPRVLIPGVNHRKLGSHVTKGAWAGMPIFTLSLEERATRPRSCAVWRECYGNGAPFAKRIDHRGQALNDTLFRELNALSAKHPRGYLVRLHFLGDFYSADYVSRWLFWLDTHPALRIFGYTAWGRDTPIGRAIDNMNRTFPDRSAIRHSVSPAPSEQPLEATTIRYTPERNVVEEGFVCPAQLGPKKDETCCGSCGLCWSPAMRDTRIVFLAHGR